MKKRIALLMVAILAALGIATPAQASPLNGCADSSFCLYQNVNFAAGRWQTSLNNIYQSTSGGVTACLNIPPAQWSNGTPVSDNSSGLVLNNSVATSPWIHYNLFVFNWQNCNPNGAYDYWGSSVVRGTLYDPYPFSNSAPYIQEYHTITSVGLIPKP